MIPLFLLKLAPYAAAVAAGVALATFAPIVGANARVERVEASRDAFKASAIAWHKNADGWKASYGKSESLRKAERTDAVKAVNSVQDQCTARVAEARRSAVAIRKITNAPVTLDAHQCPVRSVVGTDSLRDALGAR